MPLLQVQIKNLTKKYGKKIIINNLNLTIDNTRYNIIKGHNGCGKSTLIKCIMNLVKYEGKIINNNSICYVPEKIYLPPLIKVSDFLNILSKDKNKLINEYLIKFDILKYKDKYLNKLSLGTKQKIMIISSLMNDSDMYIFDEPLNGLDDFSVDVFLEELKLLKKHGKIIVIILHDSSRLSLRSKRIIRLDGENYE